MTHIKGQRDGDLHAEWGHVGTARTTDGRDLERHERQIKKHLAMHRWADTLEKIQKEGREAGKTAAGWLPIEDASCARIILIGIDNGDPEIMDWLPSWSPHTKDWGRDNGADVWALARELCHDLTQDYDPNNPVCQEVISWYEIGFQIGAEDEIIRRCHYQIGDDNAIQARH